MESEASRCENQANSFDTQAASMEAMAVAAAALKSQAAQLRAHAGAIRGGVSALRGAQTATNKYLDGIVALAQRVDLTNAQKLGQMAADIQQYTKNMTDIMNSFNDSFPLVSKDLNPLEKSVLATVVAKVANDIKQAVNVDEVVRDSLEVLPSEMKSDIEAHAKSLGKNMSELTSAELSGIIEVVAQEPKYVFTADQIAELEAQNINLDAYFKSYKEAQKELSAIDAMYPGLAEILVDPYSSVYLDPLMREYALKYLEDKMNKYGTIHLTALDYNNKVEDLYILTLVDKLLTPADTRDPLLLLGSLENIQTASGVKNGADANYLDSRLLEVFKAYSADYKTKVDQGGFYEWAEKNKLTLIVTADATMNMAQGAIAYGTLAYGGNKSISSPNKKNNLDRQEEADLNIIKNRQEIDAIRKGSPIPIPRNATYQIDYVTGKVTYIWKEYRITHIVDCDVIFEGTGTNWISEIIIPGGAKNPFYYEKYKEVLRTAQDANPLVESLINTGKLPNNYVSKDVAISAGWKGGKALGNYVEDGQMGGDIYENRTNILPNAPGRTWYEADVGLTENMSRSKQPGTRLVYSSDGEMYVTTNHYETVHYIGKYK